MRKKLFQLVLGLSCFAGGSVAMATQCGVVPETKFVDLCEGLSKSTSYEQMYRMDKPKLLEPVRDRSFGSKILRISDAGPSGVVKPLYSTVQAWNADESLLVLFANRNGRSSHELYDGRTYEWRGTLDIQPGDIEEVFWHTTDPDVLFYIDGRGNRLMSYSVKRGRQTVRHEFNKVCGGASLTTGSDLQMPSWDSRFIGLRCGGSQKTRALVMVYDIENDVLVSKGLTGKGDGNGDRYHAWTAPSVAPSGERIFFQGDISTLEFSRQRELALHKAGEHSSLGVLPNGHDALFAVGFDEARDAKRCNGSIGALVAHDLNTGECKVVIGPSSGHGYPQTSTHLSALSYRNPGWVALSSVGDTSTAKPGKLQKLFNQEIYLAYTDFKKPKVCRVTHHRSKGKDNKKLRTPYFAEPHVGISPTGTRLIFGSDWHGGNSVDTYIVELPAYEPCTP